MRACRRVGCGLAPPPWNPNRGTARRGLVSSWDASSGITLAAQPAWVAAAGASWAGAGLGPYTHTPGDVTALAHAALVVVGTRITCVFVVSGCTAGTVTFSAGTTAGTARSTNATFTEDLTVAGNTAVSWTPDAGFDGAVTIVSIACSSVASWTPRAGSSLVAAAQATATAQPWQVASGAGYVIRFVDDYLRTATYTRAQPRHIFVACLPRPAAVSARYVIDGRLQNNHRIPVSAAADLVYMASAGSFFAGPALTPSNAVVVDAVFSGAASKLAANGGAQTVGNVGVASSDGMTIGSSGSPDVASTNFNGDGWQLLDFSRELSVQERARTVSWLRRDALLRGLVVP